MTADDGGESSERRGGGIEARADGGYNKAAGCWKSDARYEVTSRGEIGAGRPRAVVSGGQDPAERGSQLKQVGRNRSRKRRSEIERLQRVSATLLCHVQCMWIMQRGIW